MPMLGQIVAAAPDDSANWLRLARTIMQIRPADDSEQTFLLERASTAAYIAYQRAGKPQRGGRQPGGARPRRWRSASCGGRRSMRCGSRSNCARSPTCAANTRRCATSTASACSITPSIPTPPRRAPASSSPRILPTRTDFSPFLALAGNDKPALSAEEKQLCVEGLKHGERYNDHVCAPACRRP